MLITFIVGWIWYTISLTSQKKKTKVHSFMRIGTNPWNHNITTRVLGLNIVFSKLVLKTYTYQTIWHSTVVLGYAFKTWLGLTNNIDMASLEEMCLIVIVLLKAQFHVLSEIISWSPNFKTNSPGIELNSKVLHILSK